MKKFRIETLSPTTLYLLQEAALILLFSYFILAGGTINGLLRFRLRLMSHLLLFTVFALWLGYRHRRRQRLTQSALDLPIVIFLLAQLGTAILSTDPRRSLGYLGLMGIYALSFYLLSDLLVKGWPAELLVKCLLIIGAIVIGFGLADMAGWYVGWWTLGGAARPLPPTQLRIYSILGDANMTASFLNLLIPLALVRIGGTKARFSRLLLGLWLLGALIVQFFTSSRGGWLGTATAVAASVGLLVIVSGGRGRMETWWRTLRTKPWLLILTSLGLAVLAASGLWLALKQLQHPSHGGILAARREFWLSAWYAFLRSPLWGTGPFTYGTQFMKYTPIPPWRPYPHAHSYLVTTAAEMGLIGLVASGWMALAIVVAFKRTWQSAGRAHRLLMAGCSASLLGFSVHSLVDNHVAVPAIALALIAALALALNDQLDQGSGGGDWGSGIRVRMLLVPGLLLAAGLFWSDLAYWPFIQGVQLANQGQWAQAAVLIDKAASLDPYLAFYRLQSGYVHGRLAAEEPAHLEQAVEQYERGITLEPYYSLNHANLASLYWQAGREEEALQQMQAAINLAPGESLYHLNLGYYYERLGFNEDATREYQLFLTKKPDLVEGGYWRQTPLRQQSVEKWKEANPKPTIPSSPRSYGDYARLGWQELGQKQYEKALAAFQMALSLNDAQIEAYHGLGATYMALGEHEQAEYYLQAALNIFTFNMGEKMEPLLTRGRLAYLQGELDEAITNYELALGMVEEYTIYGWGTLGWSPYGHFLFQRESIAPDLLPQLVRADITDSLAERYLELGGWYEEIGDRDKAIDTYRRVLAAVPDFTAAVRRLEELW
jgi:tetratricopeptide (TPR) repeat protein/O-antigen ligase